MSLFSSHWYRVGPLRPRLRAAASVSRQVFRGEVWYVVVDHLSGRTFRLTPAAHRIVGLMDGKRTLEDIWLLSADSLGDELPGQDEIIALLARLHQSDLLVTDTVPDLAEFGQRRDTYSRRQLLQKLKSPLAVRIPLFDPDRFLTRTEPYVRPLLSVGGLVAALALMLLALATAAVHWGELSSNLYDRVITAQNLVLMVLVYPVAKALHELGHAYAVKRFGGEVHEIGVMLLLFFPVPYVDASASSAWPSKWQRITVSAMGILVELVLASAALLVWVNVEQGLVSALAFATMITAGVSTLVFNGNPLLRFDGYYVLADLIEVPNLGQRSNTYLAYLVKRYAFGLKGVRSPAGAPGERAWMVNYALAAYAYRLAISFSIIFYVADHFFILGTVLAAIAFAQMVVWPALKGVLYAMFNGEVRSRRRRAVAVTGAAIAAVVAALALVPLPYGGVVQGVVWVPEGARVVAESPGIIEQMLVAPGQKIGPGTEIARLSNDELSARVDMLEARVRVLEARVAAEVRNGPAAVAQAREQLAHAVSGLEEAKSRAQRLVVRSSVGGTFIPAFEGEVRGRYVPKGERLGFVLDPASPPMVHLAVPDFEADLIRARIRHVSFRFAERFGALVPARIVREMPAARDTLPSKALSTEGAGPFYLDPQGAQRLKTLQQIFVFECEVTEPLPLERVGGRVFARLDYGWAPLLLQLYRPLRQLVLKQLKI